MTEQGTPLDAELSAALLKTLFYPGTVLHDMGVVIQNGRIAAAGCQFPLAESEDVDPSLGSRHRAAMGLAQDTDALVIVVSEETGRISAACEGQWYPGLDPDSLRQLLQATLGTSPREARFRLQRLLRSRPGGRKTTEGKQP
jgi:diadenylate cyclase